MANLSSLLWLTVGAPNGINLSIVYEQDLDFQDISLSGWIKDLIAAQHTAGAPGTSTSGPAGASPLQSP